MILLLLACTAPGGKADSDTAATASHSGTGSDSGAGSDSGGGSDSGTDTGAPLTAGTLDFDFGVEGVVTFDSERGHDRGRWVVQQADGGIVAVGKSNEDFILLRYDGMGGVDYGFGGGDGIATTDFSGSGDSDDEGKSVRIQADQKIVLAGITTRAGNGDGNGDFGIARYDTAGVLDYAFHGVGYTHTDIYEGSYYDEGKSLAIQADGKYVVGGKGNNGSDDDFALVRYNVDGELDPGFGNLRPGVSTVDLDLDADEGNSVAIQPDGMILLAGYTRGVVGDEFAVLRFDDLGQIDTYFGDQGVAQVAVGQEDVAFSTTVADDGTILLAGHSSDGVRNRFAAARLTPDGLPDHSFADNGVFTMEIGEVDDICVGAALQADGKILLAGSAIGPADSEVIVLRLLTDGTPDPGFGDGGIARFGFGGTRPGAYAIALQADGKILVVGDNNNGVDIDIAVARLLAE